MTNSGVSWCLHGLSPLSHRNSYPAPIGPSRASELASGLQICCVSSPSISRSLKRTDSFRSRMAWYHLRLEKSLLGAEVNRIVDSLSLGWYESIFQSYWASKVRRAHFVSSRTTLIAWLASTLAGEGCIVDGRAVRREKLHPESSRGHIICGECNAYNRFVSSRYGLTLTKLSVLRGCLDVRFTYGGCAYSSAGFRR